MVNHLRGFLHPISEASYNHLLSLGYKYLYRDNSNNTFTTYFLIFGPITIPRRELLCGESISKLVAVKCIMTKNLGKMDSSTMMDIP